MDHVMHHLELEKERLKSSKPNTNMFMATTSSRKALHRKKGYFSKK